MALKRRIVAVDDSVITLKILEKVLGKNYDVHAFSKGMRAFRYMEQEVPDLIILDIDMPELDGFELMKMIKDVRNLKYVPIIFLTSNGGKDYVVKAITSGANDYVVKPIDEDILMQKITKILPAF